MSCPSTTAIWRRRPTTDTDQLGAGLQAAALQVRGRADRPGELVNSYSLVFVSGTAGDRQRNLGQVLLPGRRRSRRRGGRQADLEQFSTQCDHHEERLKPFTSRYGSHPSGEPERLHADGSPRRAVAVWACCVIFMIFTCLLAIWTWPGDLSARPLRGHATRSSLAPWTNVPRRSKLMRSG